jgi:hypothetical protein
VNFTIATFAAALVPPGVSEVDTQAETGLGVTEVLKLTAEVATAAEPVATRVDAPVITAAEVTVALTVPVPPGFTRTLTTRKTR